MTTSAALAYAPVVLHDVCRVAPGRYLATRWVAFPPTGDRAPISLGVWPTAALAEMVCAADRDGIVAEVTRLGWSARLVRRVA